MFNITSFSNVSDFTQETFRCRHQFYIG